MTLKYFFFSMRKTIHVNITMRDERRVRVSAISLSSDAISEQ